MEVPLGGLEHARRYIHERPASADPEVPRAGTGLRALGGLSAFCELHTANGVRAYPLLTGTLRTGEITQCYSCTALPTAR